MPCSYKSKEKEAREELRRKARIIKQQKKESSRSGIFQHASGFGRGIQLSVGRFGQAQIPIIGVTQPYLPLQQQPAA